MTAATVAALVTTLVLLLAAEVRRVASDDVRPGLWDVRRGDYRPSRGWWAHVALTTIVVALTTALAVPELLGLLT